MPRIINDSLHNDEAHQNSWLRLHLMAAAVSVGVLVLIMIVSHSG